MPKSGNGVIGVKGIGYVSVPIVGLVDLYHEENVPQDLWENKEWGGYIKEENATYYYVEDADTGKRTWFAVAWLT